MIVYIVFIGYGLLSLSDICTSQIESIVTRKFQRLSNFADKTSTPLKTGTVRGEVRCTTLCSQEAFCVAFNMEKVGSKDIWYCEWFGSVLEMPDLTPTPGVSYFKSSMTDPTYRPNEYVYTDFDVDISTRWFIQFSVIEYCNDAHIALSSGPAATGDIYELVIGGWGNSRSVFRERKQSCQLASANTPSILNCAETRLFWLSWKDGLLSFGKGWILGENLVMKYQNTNPYTINYVSASGGFGGSGEWTILHT